MTEVTPEKFTEQRQRDLRSIINQILDKLQNALRENRSKNWNKWNPKTGQLAFNENWEIIRSGKNQWNLNKKWPEDVTWKTEHINILRAILHLPIILQAFEIINHANDKDEEEINISESEKLYLKMNIIRFIHNEFMPEKFTAQRQRDLRSVINPILGELQNAVILNRLKYWNKWNPKTGQLAFNENWEIIERSGKNQWNLNLKWPEDVTWKIEDINILRIILQAFENIDHANDKDEEKINISESEKLYLKTSIIRFIYNEFIKKRKNLEKKNNLPYKKIRKKYTEITESLIKNRELTNKQLMIYREICLALANILYSKDSKYINEDWEISQEWLKYIWKIFLKTINNLWPSEVFKKIFHDGDFNFLHEENSQWEPIIWTLDHYVRAIMYLMDYNTFNAYAEWWEKWQNARYNIRKSFLNKLFNTSQLKDSKERPATSDKSIIHEYLVNIWNQCVSQDKNQWIWESTNRLKSQKSQILKIWRPGEIVDSESGIKEITDESGVRAIYYWDMNDKNWINTSISEMVKQYLLKITNTKWIKIKNIRFAAKWDFLGNSKEKTIDELTNFIEENIPGDVNITTRPSKPKNQDSESDLDRKVNWIKWIYSELARTQLQKSLIQAYKIANWSVVRWSNWNYEDFKIIVQYSIERDSYNENTNGSENQIDEDTQIFQEISFYPHNNDLWIWNHTFLDLEKEIFYNVKNMDYPKLWKSISLNSLRELTETAIKKISFEIDIYEDKIRRWLLKKPENDNYKYLQSDWEYIIWWNQKKRSLQWLTHRTSKNTKRFDELICIILNYFLRKNKLLYLDAPNEDFNGLIEIDQLHDASRYELRRFTTSDSLRHIALDTSYSKHKIAIYTHEEKSHWPQHFEIVKVRDLWDLLNLEDSLKTKPKEKKPKKTKEK